MDIQEGDFIKFKSENKDEENYWVKSNRTYESQRTLDSNEPLEYNGKVVEICRNGYLGVKIDEKDKRNFYPPGLTIYIDKRQVLQNYSSKIVQYLTPRMALKNLWKNFIFREVKITKYNNLMYVDYKYISKTGFEKVKRFRNSHEAYSTIAPEYHHNIIPSYADFFGFTMDKAIRNNDYYYDKEIFFSKKCYVELDWSDNPTGDFIVNERGFNHEPPLSDALICGIVENGEKGLFYRKWFLCSNEFLTLWTMVCEPNNPSLYENEDYDKRDSDPWKEWKEKPKKKLKNIDNLINELDTSFYSVNLKLPINERRHKYVSYNLERAALYYPNRYKQVAEILFKNNFESSSKKPTKFQKKLVKNLMWAKNMISL